MTSKGGAAGSASERVLFLAGRGRKRMTCLSALSWLVNFLQILCRVRKEARVSFARI